MSVQNFIQTVWSNDILIGLEPESKLVQGCHRKYEGDVDHAKTVKILGVGKPTIKKYDKAVGLGDPDLMTDDGQELVITEANSFHFLVDDVDHAQSVPGLREEYTRLSTQGLALERDAYVASLIKNAKNKVTCEALTEAGVKAAIDKAIVNLRDRYFRERGRIELNPAAYNMFKNNLITLSTDNPDYIKRGIVGMYDGFEVIMSSNMAKDTDFAYCDIRGYKAIAFAGQINKVEAYRSTKYFGDEVRGLDTFGAKLIDEDRIEVVKIPLVAA